MKKLLSLIFTATMLVSCDQPTKSPQQSNKIIVGVSADYPPFEYFKDGKIIGFDIALMETLAQKTGKQAEFRDMNFDSLIGALQSNRIDVAISSISASEERKKAVDFTDTYYSGSVSMVCLQTSGVANVDDLKKQTVGLQSGSVYEAYANNELKGQVGNIQIKTLPKIPDLVQDLKSKRIACILMGATEAKRLEQEQSDLKAIHISGSETDVAIALPKNSPLTAKLNQALAEMKTDGSLGQLIQTWLK